MSHSGHIFFKLAHICLKPQRNAFDEAWTRNPSSLPISHRAP